MEDKPKDKFGNSFCGQCGSALVSAPVKAPWYDNKYDGQTGKERTETLVKCPKDRWWNIGHTYENPFEAGAGGF